MAYKFGNLSPIDFEDLTRDILQKKLELPLESFAAGRDEGIDLRYATSAGDSLIVQCKHFEKSGFRKLVSNLKNNELAKIKRLSPRRYILSTSVALTPSNKAELMKILSPFVLEQSDIIGGAEINGLLRDFPSVERKHFKL